MFNLSIGCVDGITIWGLISANKTALLNFLDRYDHEGSNINLVIKNGENFRSLDGEEVYNYLRENEEVA